MGYPCMEQGQPGRQPLRRISRSQWNIREEPHGIRKTIKVLYDFALCLL